MENVDVVVIDDDAGVGWVLQEILATERITCSLASNGPEGLELIGRHQPRLAIVDIKLGAMNGLEVARCIGDNFDRVEILFVTGYKETINGKVDPDLPVLGIIEKPFDVPELLGLIRSALPEKRDQGDGAIGSIRSGERFFS